MTGQGKQTGGPENAGAPVGCKVIGWIYILDALSVMFENGNDPTGAFNIFKTLVCFTVITSVLVMFLGRRIGLAAFSIVLVVGGVGILLSHYFSADAISFRAVAAAMLFFFIPTIYLLSHWKAFSLGDGSGNNF